MCERERGRGRVVDTATPIYAMGERPPAQPSLPSPSASGPVLWLSRPAQWRGEASQLHHGTERPRGRGRGPVRGLSGRSTAPICRRSIYAGRGGDQAGNGALLEDEAHVPRRSSEEETRRRRGRSERGSAVGGRVVTFGARRVEGLVDAFVRDGGL